MVFAYIKQLNKVQNVFRRSLNDLNIVINEARGNLFLSFRKVPTDLHVLLRYYATFNFWKTRYLFESY